MFTSSAAIPATTTAAPNVASRSQLQRNSRRGNGDRSPNGSVMSHRRQGICVLQLTDKASRGGAVNAESFTPAFPAFSASPREMFSCRSRPFPLFILRSIVSPHPVPHIPVASDTPHGFVGTPCLHGCVIDRFSDLRVAMAARAFGHFAIRFGDAQRVGESPGSEVE